MVPILVVRARPKFSGSADSDDWKRRGYHLKSAHRDRSAMRMTAVCWMPRCCGRRAPGGGPNRNVAMRRNIRDEDSHQTNPPA